MSSTFLTAPADRVANLLRAVRHAGVDVESLVLEPLAASYGALTEDERNLGVALLDMGGGGFRGALWESGRLREVRSAGGRASLPPGITPSPEGMEGIVRTLARRFRIAPASARQLLDEHGLEGRGDGARRKLIEVSAIDGVGSLRIDPDEWARDLEEFVGPAIKDLRDGLRGFSSSHAGGVVLVGQGARLKGLAALVSRYFNGAPVRLGVPRLASGDHAGGKRKRSDDWPEELSGVGGCSIHGLLAFGAELRARARQTYSSTWWGRLRLRLGRLSAMVHS
jgi:cell division protein FtsA